jgi:hypothetical protein
MERRVFLRNSAFAAAVGTSACTGSESGGAGTPKLLITSGEHPLAEMLADRLSGNYDVLLTSRNAIESKHPSQQCELDHEASTDQLVSDVDAIVHVAEPLPDDDMHQQIDHCTRRTYNLLLAAANAGVRKAVYVNTLEVMTAYGPEFVVDERWQPKPQLTGPTLPKHLGEYTCREFARVGKLPIVSLRLGTVVPSDQVSGNPMAVAAEDVAQAVRRALEMEVEDTGSSLSRWAVLHISSGSPQARFDSNRANSVLGYEPAHQG